MKTLAILLVMLVGCSSESPVYTGEYPPDAGAESSSSSSGASCAPIAWHYGVDRFCEQCTCPGTECRTHSLGEELIVGVCDENLGCSAVCNDPLWKEAQCLPKRVEYEAGVYCDVCTCPGTPCEAQAINGWHGSGVCDDELKCSVDCPNQ